MEKTTYYVNLNPISLNNISRVKVDDGQLIEYEIEATEQELKELQQLLDEVQAHDMELADLFWVKHFYEDIVDSDRNEAQDGLNKIYQKLYELGTPKTRREIEEIHLVNDEGQSSWE